jgi:hypothetical protein
MSAVVLTSKPRARARWAGPGKLLGRARACPPNGPQLASLKPGPDGRARASLPSEDHCMSDYADAHSLAGTIAEAAKAWSVESRPNF